MDAKLDQILALLNSIDERLPPAVASVSQIKGQYGDPKVNFTPKSWKHGDCKGMTASQCSADFCDVYAETLEYMARNPKPDADPKYVGYNRKDAKLFRRWAVEKRAGKAPAGKAGDASLFNDDPPASAPKKYVDDSDIPF